MKNYISIIISIILITSCKVTEEKTYLKNQITYTEKKSWWKVSLYEDEKEKTPKRLVKTTMVIVDTTKKVRYTTIEKLKKDSLGHYFKVKNTENSIKVSKNKSKFVASEYQLSGIFKPNYPIGGDKFKLQFFADGSCVYRWQTNCSDSPCFSDRMSKGIYKIFNDSVYVYFYLGKTQFYTIFKNKTNVIPIEKSRWDVKSSYNMNFVFNKTHDTLNLINEKGKKINSNFRFTLADSSKIIYEKTKDEATVKADRERKKAEYNNFIKQGDKLFYDKKYSEAYHYYNEAIIANPADTYAKSRIAELKKIEQDERDRLEKAYQSIIKKADEYFESKEYEQAKNLYEKARRIKLHEQYPHDRIALIDAILNKK